MTTFNVHNIETAPEKSKHLLQNSQKEMGMIPALHAVMAESPSTLEAYQALHKLVLNCSFNKDELTVGGNGLRPFDSIA